MDVSLAPIVTVFLVQIKELFVPAPIVGAVMYVFTAINDLVVLGRPITLQSCYHHRT